MADIYDQLLDQSNDTSGRPLPRLQTPRANDPVTVADPDVYDNLLDGYQKVQNQRLQSSLNQALTVVPEQAATVQAHAKNLGIPEDVVERNLEAIDRQVKIRELQSLLADSPILARQMADPQFAKLAHDDYKALSLLERLPRQFYGGAVEMAGRTLSGTGHTLNILQRNILTGLARMVLPEPMAGGSPTQESIVGSLAGSGAIEAGSWIKEFAQNGIMIPQHKQTFTDQVAAGLGQVGAQILLYVLTGGVAAGTTMFTQGVDIMADLTEKDSASQGAKDAAMVGGGLVTGLTERWALDRILGPLAVPVKNQVGAALTRIGIAGFSEGAQELSESVLHDVIRKSLTNREAEIDIPGAYEEGQVGFAVGAIVRGIVESALRVRVRHQRLEQQAEEAEQNTAVIDQINKIAATSKLLEVSPDSFEQFIEAAAEDGPVQDVYIDAGMLMQSGIAQELAQVSPSVAAQVEEAATLGGTVKVPIAEYAARIAPTEYAATLLDHIKTDPDGFSRAEAQTYMQTQAEQLEAEVEQRIAQMDSDNEFRESQQRVKDLVHSELNALNRFTEGKNELDATLIAARTAVRAAQLGITPEQLFERQRLRFAAENITGDTLDQQGNLQTDTPVFREWFDDSRVVDESGAPLVVYHGTVADFDAFDNSKTGANDRGLWGRGHYFSASIENANSYAMRQGDGARIIPAYVSIENPLVLTTGSDLVTRLPDGRDYKDLVGPNLDGTKIKDIALSGGHDGVIQIRPNGLIGDLVAYNPKQIKSAIGNRGTFDSNDPNILHQNQRAPRGAYSPDTNTIALLKNADLSTFLHEAGHYFFESDITLASEIVQENRMFGESSMRTGEQQILDDVSTLLRWHGIAGDINEQLATWHNLDFEEKRAYHERTAESFERYLFEGKAPSIELQSYFQQFRAWLMNVYRSLKDFLDRNPSAGELSVEVRSVFDRMLATNEEIELAETGRSMMPLFRTQADAENAGLTPEEFAAYQAQDPQASNDAIQDLQAKGLRDLQWMRNAHNREVKKLQRQSNALRREARIEARREVMNQPVYRAWTFLTRKLGSEDRLTPMRTGSDPNTVDPTQDSLLVAIAKLGGIRKADVVAEWGVDPSERPASGIFGKPVLRVTDGLGIDDMRQMLVEYGYLDGNYTDPAWDPNEFEAKFDAELRGDIQYSNQVSAEALMGEEPLAGEGNDIASLTGGRLDLPSLREMGFTEDQINVLKARRMTASQGLHPDLVAELPGIEMTSGDQLVREILEAEPPRDAIEVMTDMRMLEQHGELASPENIKREADRAIHNEARARMVATEANALARATGQSRILTSAAKQFAQTMVARVKVRDVRPSVYSNAAARAGRAAERASREGNIVQAGADKRTQLVNTYAARAAHDARTEVDRGVRYLNRFNTEGSRKGLDVEYLDQIDTLLERFDLRRGQSLRAIDRRKALAQWVEDQELAGLEPDIPDYLIHEANRTHYKELSVEQFRGLVESVRQIEHLGRLKKKLLTAKDQRDLDAIVEEITNRIIESSNGREVDNERRATFGSQAGHFARWMMATHRKASSVVREMDGFHDGGPLWEYFIRTMNEAGDKEADMRAKAAKRLHDIAQPILKGGEELGGKGRFFPTLNRSFNRGERLALALNWGNDGNKQRMLGGRNWTAAQVQPVLESLSSSDWAFVQNVWDFFESYRPEIAAKERRVYGKEPDWIEPIPFDIRTSDGEVVQLRGGYYPIKYDPQQSGRAAEFAEAEDAKAMMRAAHTAATTRRSYTKTRAEEVHGRPVLLTFDGIWQGANELIHDLSWHEWAIDANRLMKRLDDPIRTHYGAEYVDVLRTTIKDSVRGDIAATNMLEKSLNHVRIGSTVVGLGWNLTTAMLQPLGISNSIVRTGGKWIMKGLSQFYGSPLHMAAKAREVRAMSPLMENRALTMNREINDVRNRLESRSDLKLKLEATFFILIQKMQAGVDYPTWLGAYEKAMADPKNDEARAIALADQAVIDSQSGGQIKDLAQVQRGHPAMKLFTNFYSYFNVVMNLTTEQTKMRMQRKEYAALAGDYLLLMVVPAVLSGILRQALKGQDDEDEYVEEIISELIGYPLGMFVGLRDLTSAATKVFGVDTQFSYRGPAGLRFFAEMDKLGQQVGQGELDKALFKSLNSVGGLLFHYPAGQVNRLIDGTIYMLEGKTRNPSVLLGGIPY